MRLDSFIISILIFSVFVVAGTNLIVDVNSNYVDVNIDTTDYNLSQYSLNNEFNDTSVSMKNKVLGGDVDEETTENSMFLGAFSSLRLIRSSFEWVGDIMQSLSRALNIPTIFISYGMAAITIMIIFSLIYLIFRYR
jgi:hypothetical protein